jgi:hypothetical protein
LKKVFYFVGFQCIVPLPRSIQNSKRNFLKFYIIYAYAAKISVACDLDC